MHHHKCLCICEHNSEEDADGYGVDLHLNTTSQLEVTKPIS